MKSVPDWVKFAFAVAIAVAGWIYAFAKDQGSSRVEFLELKEDVKEIKDELKTYNIAVLSNELQHLSENVKANNEILKEFNTYLRELQKD